MTLFIQDAFAEARTRGLLDGFTGTFNDIVVSLQDLDAEEYFEMAA